MEALRNICIRPFDNGIQNTEVRIETGSQSITVTLIDMEVQGVAGKLGQSS